MKRLATCALLLVASLCSWQTRAADDVSAMLDRAVAGDHRTEENRARDVYRHPKETLQFIGLRPDMTVVEIWPSAGWFTDVLAPVLKDRGKLYAARYPVSPSNAPAWAVDRDRAFLARMAGRPDVFGAVVTTEIKAPEFVDAAPAGSADMVLTFTREEFTCPTVPSFDSQFHLIRSGANLSMTEQDDEQTTGSIDGNHLSLSNGTAAYDLTIVSTAVSGSLRITKGNCSARYSVSGNITPGFAGS